MAWKFFTPIPPFAQLAPTMTSIEGVSWSQVAAVATIVMRKIATLLVELYHPLDLAVNHHAL